MASAEPIAGTSQNIMDTSNNESDFRRINIGEMERLISIAGGVPMTIFGLTRGISSGLIPTLLGGSLILRGVTGHSFLYQALDVSTVHNPATIAELPSNQGIEVKRAVTINASPEELYRFWRNFQNAPRFMKNIESVQTTSDLYSQWVAKTPLGMTIAWETEVTDDEPGQVIGWRKTKGHFLAPSGGSVRFESKRNGRETVVRLEMEFRQFQGPIGSMLGEVVGQMPEQIARQNLERFKELMETGEIATTEGQPSGRRV